ncbi:hypothetical protein [Streptomyces sp. NBC_01013]|uniref:hypothetical protein n=1 Tax=Streptomyces sp. NBC_01013 TaxID=2903718 RepID=UPI00386BA969|nr:hypothetical protein OG538_00505 [Streptomyces sp. NBC_01013]
MREPVGRLITAGHCVGSRPQPATVDAFPAAPVAVAKKAQDRVANLATRQIALVFTLVVHVAAGVGVKVGG